MKYFIITGAPASGKSTILQNLLDPHIEVYDDIRTTHDMDFIINRHRGMNITCYIVIDPCSKLYKNYFDYYLTKLEGEVIHVHLTTIKRNETWK